MFFDIVLSADDAHDPKPNSDIFLRCSSKLKLPSKQCALLEDSVLWVRAAKVARMGYIAVLLGISSRIDLERRSWHG
jgi:beta-phosphoglucomutase-like phosphatase (HAD superfamily)